MSHLPLYQLIKEKTYQYRICIIFVNKQNITSASYSLCNKQKQAIALLPILSEKHRATYVFLLKHGSDCKIVNIIK